MPDLEEDIAEWRKRMAAGGVKSPAVLDELEGHLREAIQERLAAGRSETEAFEIAIARVGSPGSLRTEFNKISGAICLPVVIGACMWTMLVILVAVLMLRRVFIGEMGTLMFSHIVILTTGYLAAFLAGGFGIIYVCWQWFGRLSPAREQSLSKAVFWFTYISGGLVLGGFLLGTLWSKQHLDAYWQDSPRWWGCFCACIWTVALCLIQRFANISDHVRMLLSIVGNVVIGLSWFCAVVPHSVSNGIIRYWPMEFFFGVHLLFLLMGFSRRLEAAQSSD